MRRRAFVTAGAGLAALALGACSGSPSTSDDGDAAPTAVPDDREAPAIEVPAGDPPTELVIEDEIVGGGDEVQPADTIDVHYTGVAWSNGEEFDSSWQRNEPLSFTVGVGQVIQGWDEGLLGMKVGGRRKITIPPNMAYGEQGAQGAIAPNETLIFVCDLVGIR